MSETVFAFIKPEEYASFQRFMPALSLPYEAWVAAQEEHIRAWRRTGSVARQVTVTLEEFKAHLAGRAPNEQQLFLCASGISRSRGH
jgi:ferric-dicitrate binding protein FerR (iron transport regulator)